MANPNPSPETRWKKGQSGNPGGRPKKLSSHLREFLEADESRIPGLIEVGFRKAMEGDFAFWREIYDRVDGKATAATEESAVATLADIARLISERIQNRQPDQEPDSVSGES